MPGNNEFSNRPISLKRVRYAVDRGVEQSLVGRGQQVLENGGQRRPDHASQLFVGDGFAFERGERVIDASDDSGR